MYLGYFSHTMDYEKKHEKIRNVFTFIMATFQVWTLWAGVFCSPSKTSMLLLEIWAIGTPLLLILNAMAHAYYDEKEKGQ